MTKEQKLINSIDLFYSYAHEDEVLRNELDKHLSLLRREGLIKDWHDREIGAGTEWEREINIHLKTAQVILLLVSADFLASEYCYGIEMERAIERHEAGEARVIPIILRPADLKSAPFSKLQPLPTNGIPITEWSNRDRAFVNVTEGIRKAVEDLSKKSSFGLLSPRPDISQARHINGNDPEGPTAQPNIHPSPTKASKGTGTMSKKHMGSSIDDFLKEEGIFEEAQAQAVKEVVAWQLAAAMKKRKISKSKMALLLKTSRPQVDRLLDPNCDITLSTLQRAAAVVGRRVTITLV